MYASTLRFSRLTKSISGYCNYSVALHVHTYSNKPFSFNTSSPFKSDICCNTSLCCKSIYSSSILHGKAKKKNKEVKVKIVVRPVDAEDFIDLVSFESSMKTKVLQLQEEFITQFVVKMDASVFENVKVNIDNQIYMLNEIAVVNQDTPHLISVDMTFYPEYISPVSDAIRQHFPNLNPIIDGTLIKLPISNRSPEHRLAMERKMKERLNKSKENLKKFTNQETTELKAKEDEGLSKNLFHLICEQMDIFQKHYSSKMDDIYKSKSKEFLDS